MNALENMHFEIGVSKVEIYLILAQSKIFLRQIFKIHAAWNKHFNKYYNILGCFYINIDFHVKEIEKNHRKILKLFITMM